MKFVQLTKLVRLGSSAAPGSGVLVRVSNIVNSRRHF